MTDHLAIMIDDNAKRFAAQPAMRVKVGESWRTISYAELGRRIDSVAKSLVDYGVKSGDMVAIFSPNCPEWTIADFAIMRAGAVSVPIYATSTAKQAEYVLTDADVSLVFVGDQAQYDKILSCPPDPARTLRVVAFDDDTALTGGDSVHLRDFEAAGAASSNGAEVQERMAAARPEDVATLVYTSGTTGQPKGAVITHANVFHQIHALDDRFNVGPGDSSLCFLPLSHAYERGWSFYIFATGAQNCYLQDPRRIAETMIEVRPSTMVSVPRLFEKIHATVVDRVDRGPAVKARLFEWAIDVGGKYQHQRYADESIGPILRAQHAVADRLV
ncbi:MAG: AMP-binding protein, partial [Actinomycetes bacterium]